MVVPGLEAHVGARLEEQLEDQAREILGRSPEKDRVDVAERTVRVSSILVWYREDLSGAPARPSAASGRYWAEGEERQLFRSGRFRPPETRYDWTLNSVEKGRRAHASESQQARRG